IKNIVQNLPQSIDLVGVFANTTIDVIAEIVNYTGLTIVQLHGNENSAFCQELKANLPEKIKIIKALIIKDETDLKNAANYYNDVDILLLDAYHPQILGGTGQTLDWQILQEFKPPLPWFLAGGLNPDNILDCLEVLHPDGIDLSSGVENSPGDKDLIKVKLLFDRLNSQKI
ncbi:MAG TPA: phosphoribosylanthranilate isomerase, partial [Allocoleopsis sp.]